MDDILIIVDKIKIIIKIKIKFCELNSILYLKTLYLNKSSFSFKTLNIGINNPIDSISKIELKNVKIIEK